jgi:hypothetical protein
MPNEPVNPRSILPPPDPPFRGEINMAYADSKADTPEPLRAPDGAPNVLAIVGDDIGYGPMGAFGRPDRHGRCDPGRGALGGLYRPRPLGGR